MCIDFAMRIESNAANLSVHRHFGFSHISAKVMPNTLMSQADSKNIFCFVKRFYNLQGYSGILWIARSRRKYDVMKIHL